MARNDKTDQQSTEPASEPEPTLDHAALRFEVGHPAELVAHIKEWVEWRLKQ